MNERRYEIQFTSGVEGPHLSVWSLDSEGKPSSGFRMCGPKAWGGGQTLHRWKVNKDDLCSAFPHVAALEAKAQAAERLLAALELVMSAHMGSEKGGHWIQIRSFQDSLDGFVAAITQAHAAGVTSHSEEVAG